MSVGAAFLMGWSQYLICMNRRVVATLMLCFMSHGFSFLSNKIELEDGFTMLPSAQALRVVSLIRSSSSSSRLSLCQQLHREDDILKSRQTINHCPLNGIHIQSLRRQIRRGNEVAASRIIDDKEEATTAYPPSTVMTTDDHQHLIRSDDTTDADSNNTDKENEQEDDKSKWRTVLHGVTRRTMALNEAVSMVCHDNDIPINVQDAVKLIQIGAVWAKMETISEQDVLDQYDYYDNSSSGSSNAGEYNNAGGAMAQMKYGDMPKGWGGPNDSAGIMNGQASDDQDLDEYIASIKSLRFKRILSPCIIEQGTDLRIYPYPRRFKESCQSLSSPGSLLYEDTTYIVVDKPPMLPTQPDASNYEECLPGCVQRHLGPFTTIDGKPVVRPLLCHRVDSVVGGCVVLSKDPNGQKVFSRLQRERKVKKIYLAVTTKPVPLGMHIHWMWSSNHIRGVDNGPPCQLVSHKTPSSRRVAKNFWIRCVLEVTKCQPIDIVQDVKNNDDNYYTPPTKDTKHYQSTIRLVTGRKHQVRAQLASLGTPIIRDTLYEPIAGLTLDQLEDLEEEQQYNDKNNDNDNPLDCAISKCRIPTKPIGLQAHAISFGDGSIQSRARTPWWGNKIVDSSTRTN